MESVSIKEQLAQHGSQILRLRDLMDLAFARGARSMNSSEDRVVFPLLVACRDIVEEILFSASEGFGRLALRSVRTMYECLVFARYLHKNPEKTDDYLATFHAQWGKVLRNIPRAENGMPEVHKVVSEKVPAYASGKFIDLDWSDKTTVQMAEEVGIPREFHAWAFNYASGFVHPSAMFLLRHLSQKEEGPIQISAGDQDQEARFAIRFCHCLILSALKLRLEYAPSQGFRDQLHACEEDFKSVWGYPSPL